MSLYRQNILCITALWILGFSLEFWTQGRGVNLPAFPWNLIFLVFFVWLQFLIFYFGPKRLYARLVSVPFAVVSVVAMALLVIISGSFNEKTIASIPLLKRFGFSHITRSWPYLLTAAAVASSLATSILKRLTSWPLRFKTVPDLLAHLGLLIVLLAGSLGNADLQRLRFDLFLSEKTPVAFAYDPETKSQNGPALIPMPFALRLDRFDLEEWPPELVLVDHQSKVLKKCPSSIEATKNFYCTLSDPQNGQNFEIKLLDYISEALPNAQAIDYLQTSEAGSTPAAKIEVRVKTESNADKIFSGWVAMGSFLTAPALLKLSDLLAIGMPLRKPKLFRSEVTYFTQRGETGRAALEVNRPFSIEGWKLYQFGYDDTAGKHSELSVIEAVFDPWLWVVYLGLLMLVLGVLLRAFLPRSVFKTFDLEQDPTKALL